MLREAGALLLSTVFVFGENAERNSDVQTNCLRKYQNCSLDPFPCSVIN